MPDIYHYFGGDASVGATGDFAYADGDKETQQRIIRRLLTYPGDYLWHPDFGAGLGAYVGATTGSLKEIEAICVAQITSDEGVAQMPPPTVSLKSSGNDLSVKITYRDKVSTELKTFSFNVSE